MRKRLDVLICTGANCLSSHSLEFKKKLEEELERRQLQEEVNIVGTGCMGPCQLGPVMIVYPEGSFYVKLKDEDIPQIVEEHFLKGRPVKRLLWTAPEAAKIVEEKKKIPFFEKQEKVVLKNCGRIDPENIEEYIAYGGYEALAKVMSEMTPEKVIEELIKSKLVGRGGAGFPTGLKWKFTREAKGDEKYVVCNADEGDPGAFKDRAILEGDPHAVIEGMIIAGYTIGAHHGYIYIRAEYPLAIKRLEIALEQARKYGLLGKNILETGFDFDIELRMGAGAFVAGEETALLNSLEGKRGTPRFKPPYPAQKGVWGKPTLVNNVETLANIRHIILNGGEWFASMGTENSKGTKLFALSGKVNNTGLIEVPFGLTLGEVIFDIGGGIPKGKRFKAIQMGGPSGGYITSEFLNLPVDYKEIEKTGSIIGSAGMIVLDEDNCMVNMAKFFVEFTMSESCGQCTPCRVGLKQMYSILDRITNGQGTLEDLTLLEKLGKQIKSSSMCALGQTAPNPVLTGLKYFPEEFLEHVLYKKCRAGVCASLFYAPCTNACPAGVDVPRYLAHMTEGRLKEAFLVHMENNPFPSVCARVCPAFCERPCERGKFDEPIAIREVKRLFADWARENDVQFNPPLELRKEKVAIVGAGPAGLSCAYFLTRLGYRPVVFESLPVPGGMMRVGIPDYRLPKDVLNEEIARIVESGVELRLNSPVSSLQELKEMGFDAVFISIGAHRSEKLNVKGEELEGITGGIDFLREVNLGKKMDLKGKRVAVVGGGSTAMDAARTALRLKASEVSVIYRRSREEMPAQATEVEEAIEEGIKFYFLTNPIEFTGSTRVEKIRCVQMEFQGFDKSGRRRPVPKEGTEFEIEADFVLLCLGQRPELSGFAEELETNRDGTIKVDKDTLETSLTGVFAGGDAVLGPATVVEAVGQGRKAALSIDRHFGYEGKFPFPRREVVETSFNEEEYLKVIPRKTPALEMVEERIKSFIEVNKGILLQEALEESKRCLKCDRGKEVVSEKLEKEKVRIPLGG
jgi:NADH-quinone oxidoreductase subunit F